LILLDTHAWVWWLSDPDKIPARSRKLLTQAAEQTTIYISCISAWEIMLLEAKHRLQFSTDAEDWIRKAEALPFLRFVPVDNTIAMRSVRLPQPFPKDPADRIIVASAVILGATLITADARIRSYRHVRTAWQ
jgi:PIN domain nuclease of toxin-antitoxin system